MLALLEASLYTGIWSLLSGRELASTRVGRRVEGRAQTREPA